MAKLFNNIRKKIITDKPSVSRTTNYLKYAIGEIVLVVVGILIALSINNWNKTQADIKVERDYMQNLLEDLKTDVNLYSDYAKNNASIYNLIDSLVPKIKNPNRNLYASKLAFWARMVTIKITQIHPVKRTYEQMKSSGHLRLIKNQQVSNDISYYYNSLSVIETYNDAGLLQVIEYIKAMGEIFDAEVLLNVLKERKEQNTDATILLTEDIVTLNKLINIAQYYYGSMKLAESSGKERSTTAMELIELIQKEYHLQ